MGGGWVVEYDGTLWYIMGWDGAFWILGIRNWFGWGKDALHRKRC